MFGLVMSEDRLSLQPRRREIIQVHITCQHHQLYHPVHHLNHHDEDGEWQSMNGEFLQALKELPEKIRKVLEVDAHVLKVAQVDTILNGTIIIISSVFILILMATIMINIIINIGLFKVKVAQVADIDSSKPSS